MKKQGKFLVFHSSEFNYVGAYQYNIKHVSPKQILIFQGKFIFKRD